MEISKIKNPFTKGEAPVDAPVKAPEASVEESVAVDNNINAIESTNEEVVKEEKQPEVTIQEVLENFELRLRKIEYNLRLI